jgi:hypothetical protein
VTPARRLRGAAASFSLGKLAIAVVGIGYLYIAAATVSSAQTAVGDISWPKVIALSIAPLCIFWALRYPIVFPFGLYVALIPFDALLTLSSTALIVKFVGFAAFGAFGLRMLRMRTVLLPHQSWYAWLAYIAYNALTLLWTADYVSGSRTMISILLLFTMMTLLAVYPVTTREFKIVTTIALVCGVGAAFYCIHEFYGGQTTTEIAPRLDLSVGDFSIDANYLAGAFLLPIGIALGAIFFAKRRVVKLASALAVAPLMMAIFVTGSREALSAAAAMFLYFVIRSKHRLIALAIGVLCIGSLVFFPSIFTRMFESNIADGSGRTEIWLTGMHSFADHWLLGAGIGSYSAIYDNNILQVAMRSFPGWHRPGHSIIFEDLNDYGVAGSAIVIACWFLSFRQLRVIPKTSNLYGFRVACEAMIIGYGVQALFIDPTYIKYIWLAHSLPLLLLNLYDPRAIGFRERSISIQPRLRSMRAQSGA